MFPWHHDGTCYGEKTARNLRLYHSNIDVGLQWERANANYCPNGVAHNNHDASANQAIYTGIYPIIAHC